jgi:DNA helicase HerA-like ATPase
MEYKISNVIDERTYELFIPLKEHENREKIGSFLIIEYLNKKFIALIEEEKTVSVSDYEKLTTLKETNVEDLEFFDIEFSVYLICKIKLIGYIENNEIKTDIRKCVLPIKSKIRKPTEKELEIILNPNNEKKCETNIIGYYSVGELVFKEFPIYFDPENFKNKRSAVFAKTGFGKSNLTKLLILKILEHNDESDDKFGIFVFDIDGEYYKTQEQNIGFKEICGDVIVISNVNEKHISKVKRHNHIPLKINFSVLEPREVANLLISAFRREDLVGINILSKFDPDAWKTLWKNKNEDDFLNVVDELCEIMEGDNVTEGSINALRWRLEILLRKLHSFDGISKEDIEKFVKNRDFVIFGLNSIENKWGRVFSDFVCTKAFEKAQELFLDGNSTNLIFVFEEAQNLLVDEDSIYTRITKEGRKYGLGTVLITQQPSSIPNEIISQVDNFFVFHLLNDGDINALIYSNKHYKCVSKFIQNETIQGLAYIYYGKKQPYVLPAKILEFNKEVERYKNRKRKPDIEALV